MQDDDHDPGPAGRFFGQVPVQGQDLGDEGRQDDGPQTLGEQQFQTALVQRVNHQDVED
jgi:hypothetical protein